MEDEERGRSGERGGEFADDRVGRSGRQRGDRREIRRCRTTSGRIEQHDEALRVVVGVPAALQTCGIRASGAG